MLLWGLLVVSSILSPAIFSVEADDVAPNSGLKFEPNSKYQNENETLQKSILYPTPLHTVHHVEGEVEIVEMAHESNLEFHLETLQEVDQDGHHGISVSEAQEHIKQVAEDSKNLALETEPQHIGDLLLPEGEHPDVHQLKDSREVEVTPRSEVGEEADDVSNVELLRRSDRRRAGETKYSERVFVKTFPPPREVHEFPVAEAHHEEEEEFISEIVYLDTPSHQHVVHQNKDYARVVFHDEM
ncbi:uncharacterized protein LOC124141362 [Haliotis rufescens]|uniref:uncharacterized protein LOC124141362 n=1 Tax=Haliotis rufescens TaxID=6454 RepID=UPI00201ED5EA|nr:uncharacterized protein LOC124141362 [Haliotis rufescens]